MYLTVPSIASLLFHPNKMGRILNQKYVPSEVHTQKIIGSIICIVAATKPSMPTSFGQMSDLIQEKLWMELVENKSHVY
jgi:hypothetical protein